MAKFLFYDDKIINILLQEEKPSGGAAVQAYGWIRGLSEVGQDIQVLTNVNKKEALKAECKDINLLPLYEPQKGVRWLRWVYYRLPYIYRKIRQAKPDYLYQGIPGWSSFIIGIICRQLNIRYILRISNDFLLDDRFYRSHSKTHSFFQQMGIKLSYCILCQNDYQYQIVRKRFPHKPALKISNPIFLKSRLTPGGVHSRSYIAWIGLFQYQKNLGLLFEIASKLKEEQFVVAGGEAKNFDEDTSKYLEKLKALPNVKFVGFLKRAEVPAFLAKARFLLNTSHYEGFSNTFLEAMSVGTPIISSNNVNPDAIITNYQLGIVYKDVNDLKEQYFHLTPELYKKMSENALDYVVQQHDYKVLSLRLMKFLSKEPL